VTCAITIKLPVGPPGGGDESVEDSGSSESSDSDSGDDSGDDSSDEGGDSSAASAGESEKAAAGAEANEDAPPEDCENIYNGCSLTTKEKDEMIELTCDSVV
jgi:hypothetical protein